MWVQAKGPRTEAEGAVLVLVIISGPPEEIIGVNTTSPVARETFRTLGCFACTYWHFVFDRSEIKEKWFLDLRELSSRT